MDVRTIKREAPTGFLRIGLWAGVAYFCCMAVAHFYGLKYPLLFVYYDVPFYAYQDKIISFAVVAYVCLFVNAALNRSAVPFALIALGVTVLGLSAVNVSAALAAVLDGRSTGVYWLQTALIAAYLVGLLVLYAADGRRAATGSRTAGSPE
ncbi:MAG: hypothetical protein ACKOQ4_13905 [Mycobacterium sp.]